MVGPCDLALVAGVIAVALGLAALVAFVGFLAVDRRFVRGVQARWQGRR